MSTGLQVAGLASNFDWKSFVDQIINLERTPAARLERDQALNRQKVSLMDTLGTKLTALQTAVRDLKTDTLFGKRSATSSLSGSTWRPSAGVNTVTGAYSFAVSQLATTAKLAGATDIGSALNPASNDVSGLTLANLPIGQAVTAGTFTVNGAQVSVALTDSLQDVFDAISTATGGTVTAAYSSSTDGVTLTSSSGAVMLGAANDTSNFLRALRLNNNGTASVSSSARLGSVKPAATLANANLSTAITAVDGAGAGTFSINGVAIAYNVNTDSLSSVIANINASTAGVSASYDPLTDRLTLANKGTGDLGISVSESTGGLLGALGLTSGTTFTRGNNAEFTLNGGATFSSLSNTLDASAHGVTGLSVTVDSTSSQTITVAADTSAMRTKIEKFVQEFNGVQEFIDTQTRVSTNARGEVNAAALSGNREIQDWATSLRRMVFAAVGGLTGSVKRLDDLGLDFKAGTSQLEIEDGAKLDQALAQNTADVQAFFTTATTGFGAKLDTYLGQLETKNDDQQKALNNQTTSLGEQIATIERRLVQRRELLESAFIRMEEAQQKLKQQQTSLDAIFAKKSS
ncbi:MAG: flagellar filament capping protein FliD [Opitutaceae bacterium]|nr:flagellar filament capping protein FliD [Opitutaceae bacterium]